MPRQTGPMSTSRGGRADNSIDTAVRSTPTGRHRARSYTQPAFSHLRRSTSDHPDSAVFDEWDEHHPHDDIEETDEHENDNDENGDRAPQARDFAGTEHSTSSEDTLAEERRQQNDLSTAEKGHSAAASKEVGSKPEPISTPQQGIKRRKTQAGVPAEKREWPDNIVTFDSEQDPANPKNWTPRKKVIITMLFGMTTMCSTFASSVYSPAVTYVAAEYGISSEVAILGLSLFVLGYVPGPVIFAPISELYGRVPSVLMPMFIFACFSIATATSENIQSIMITRFFAGLFASAPVANVGGGLADMFEARERGNAVVFYSLAVVAGPTLGPIIGGAVAQSPRLGWRWTEYLTVILICTVLLLDIIFIKETFAPVLLTRKARQLRWKTKRWALHSKQEETEFSLKRFLSKNLTLPLRMFVTEPMVLCICLFNSFVYGVLYLLFAAVPIIFEQERGWNTLVGSLPFLAVLLGCMTSAAINVLYSTKVFGPHLDRNGGKAEPEMRLPPMMLGSILFPIGFFLMGWTANPSIHWFPCVLGLYFVGTSFLLIFQAGINYLIDAYTTYAASAVASNTFLRSIFAAALPLVAQPMFNNLGVQWACTLLGCLSLLLCAIPFLFYKYGAKLRSMSKLAEHK